MLTTLPTRTLQRQREPEGTPVPRALALDPELAPMRLDQRPGDVEPEPESWCAVVAVRPEELIEQVGQGFGRNPEPFVANTHAAPVSQALDLDGDVAAVG